MARIDCGRQNPCIQQSVDGHLYVLTRNLVPLCYLR